jgi:hypothetical protein
MPKTPSLVAALLAMLLCASARAAETPPAEQKPAEKKPAEAKADRTVDKYVSKTADKCEEPRFWVTPEFLAMWTKDGPVHDLGILANMALWTSPNAQFVFKNNEQDYGTQLGGRLTFGMWADEAREWGFELSGFALEKKSDSFGYTGDTVAFTFVDAITGREESLGFGWTDQRLKIESESQLWGVEGLGRHRLVRGEHLALDLTFGVKHLDLSEDLHIRLSAADPVFPLACHDSFSTHNQFFGAKVGVKFAYTAWDRLLLEVQPAVSLGATREELKVSGYSFVGGFGSGPGFAYSALSNMGTHTQTPFAVAPEIKVGLGCKITQKLSFNASYNLLYLSETLRPGEQISRRVSEGSIIAGLLGGPTTPPAPCARMQSTDYWAQGVSAGFKIKF